MMNIMKNHTLLPDLPGLPFCKTTESLARCPLLFLISIFILSNTLIYSHGIVPTVSKKIVTFPYQYDIMGGLPSLSGIDLGSSGKIAILKSLELAH
jgi:hypothetical protein